MKTYQIILLFFLVWSSNFAQSGRPIPTPEPYSENSRAIDSKNEIEPCEENSNEIEFIGLTERDAFIEKINGYGFCGYRLENLARVPFHKNETLAQMTLAGVVKKDLNNKYEYSWFIAERPGEAQTLANNLAEKGFYLKKSMSFTIGKCSDQAEKTKQENKDSGVLGAIMNLTLGDNGIFFLFERKIGSEKKNEYRVIDAFDSRTKDIKINESKMQDLISKGFRPIDFWYLGFLNYNFLIMEKDNDIKPEGEYILIKDSYSKEKTLTKLAKEGYKLLIQGGDLAVLNRTEQKPLDIKYYSAENIKDVRRIYSSSTNDIIFVETGIGFIPISCDHIEGRWFFLTPIEKENVIKNKETFFLNNSEVTDKYLREKGLPEKFKFIPRTKEQETEYLQKFNKQINQLVKENYKLIKFDYLDGFTLMFERPKQ